MIWTGADVVTCGDYVIVSLNGRWTTSNGYVDIFNKWTSGIESFSPFNGCHIINILSVTRLQLLMGVI